MRGWISKVLVTIVAFGAAYFASSALANATEGTPQPKTVAVDVATAVPDLAGTTTTTLVASEPATTVPARTVAVDADQLQTLEVAPADDAAAAARQQSDIAFRFVDPCIGTCPDIDPATIHPLQDPL